MNISDRFLEKAIPEPNSGCWLWIGAMDGKGYGSFSLNRRSIPAHQVSWLLFRGEKNGLVCHHCDTPICVNPDHLFLGTNTDNMRDMVRKGRMKSTKGEANGRARLTEEAARAAIADPRTAKEVAKDLGVSTSTILMLRCGRNWPHLQDAAGKPQQPFSKSDRSAAMKRAWITRRANTSKRAGSSE